MHSNNVYSNFITNNVLYLDPTDVVPVHFDIFEISDDMISTPLTSDLYSIDINDDDHILAEFPVLRADSVPSQASKTKPEQTEAQKRQYGSSARNSSIHTEIPHLIHFRTRAPRKRKSKAYSGYPAKFLMQKIWKYGMVYVNTRFIW